MQHLGAASQTSTSRYTMTHSRTYSTRHSEYTMTSSHPRRTYLSHLMASAPLPLNGWSLSTATAQLHLQAMSIKYGTNMLPLQKTVTEMATHCILEPCLVKTHLWKYLNINRTKSFRTKLLGAKALFNKIIPVEYVCCAYTFFLFCLKLQPSFLHTLPDT